jgi:hypothetical protein
LTLRSGGVPETTPPGEAGRETIAEATERQTMTAATANISCGALID